MSGEVKLSLRATKVLAMDFKDELNKIGQSGDALGEIVTKVAEEMNTAGGNEAARQIKASIESTKITATSLQQIASNLHDRAEAMEKATGGEA